MRPCQRSRPYGTGLASRRRSSLRSWRNAIRALYRSGFPAAISPICIPCYVSAKMQSSVAFHGTTNGYSHSGNAMNAKSHENILLSDEQKEWLREIVSELEHLDDEIDLLRLKREEILSRSSMLGFDADAVDELVQERQLCPDDV